MKADRSIKRFADDLTLTCDWWEKVLTTILQQLILKTMLDFLSQLPAVTSATLFTCFFMGSSRHLLMPPEEQISYHQGQQIHAMQRQYDLQWFLLINISCEEKKIETNSLFVNWILVDGCILLKLFFIWFPQAWKAVSAISPPYITAG